MLRHYLKRFPDCLIRGNLTCLVFSSQLHLETPAPLVDVFFHSDVNSHGDKYVGEFKDGNYHGKGIETFIAGGSYFGEYKGGKRNGQGTHAFANGDKYVGEFRDDDYNGQGTFTFANGGGFSGEWKDDKPHGRGIETYADGSPAKEGVFENGRFIRAEKFNLPQ